MESPQTSSAGGGKIGDDRIGELRSEPQVAFDAGAVEAAREAGCRRVLSEDLQRGLEIGGVVVDNPFG